MTRRRMIWLIALYLVGAAVIAFQSTDARTIVVDDDDGHWADYSSIQDALDNATKGDVILVYNGTYSEEIVVDVSVTIIGNGSSNTTISGSGGDVVTVNSGGVYFSGFEVTGGSRGIVLNETHIEVSRCRIHNNSEIGVSVGRQTVILVSSHLSFNGIGLDVQYAMNVTSDNTTFENTMDIRLVNSSAMTAVNCTFTALSVDSTSRLVVRNYLHVYIRSSGGDPVRGGDIEVLDNDRSIYASAGFGGSDPRTDDAGYVKWILVTDRIYNGSSEATENETTVKVKYGDWGDSRSVDMSTSHTEEFTYIYTGDVIYVDDDNSGDPAMDGSREHPFDEIQKAIDNATAGKTIRVFEGIYQENVVVNVSSLRIIGNGSANTTIDGGGSGDVVHVNVSHLLIKGFHITDSGNGAIDSGITIEGVANITISDCHLSGNQRGITFDSARRSGVQGVTSENCNADGIYIDGSDRVYVNDTTSASNGNAGIYSTGSTNVTLMNSTAHSNVYGVYMTSTSYLRIISSDLFSNSDTGVYMTSSDHVNISYSQITDNGRGVYVTSTTDAHLLACLIRTSTGNGISFRVSSDRFAVETCNVTENDNGISIASSTGAIGNTSIYSSNRYDFEIFSDGHATSINVTFNGSKVSCDFTSDLVVKNYLKVMAEDQYGDPLPGAEVKVEDENTTIYASPGYGGDDPATDESGETPWILVTDRIYEGSSDATENLTHAYVKYGDEEQDREINMSTTHVEVFAFSVSQENVIYVDDDNKGDPQMDGSKDHPYDQIQKGIDNATAGYIIRVFEGIYNESVIVNKTVVVRGNGTVTLVRPPSNREGIRIDASSTVVESLKIESSDRGYQGVLISSSGSNATVRHVVISGAMYDIYASDTNGLTFEDVICANASYGVFLIRVENSTIRESYFLNCYYGIRGYRVSYLDVTGNRITGSNIGLYLDTVQNTSISHNEIWNTSDGMYVLNYWGGSDIAVRGNNLTGISNIGIYVYNTDKCRIEENNVHSTHVGIYTNTCTRALIRRNVLQNVTGGIDVYSDRGDLLSDNSVTNASDHGICLLYAETWKEGDEIVSFNVTNNTLVNASYGLFIYASRSTQVWNNRLLNNEISGLYLVYSSYLILRDNVLENNTYNMGVFGSEIDQYSHDIDESNLINGLPVIYVVNGTRNLFGRAGFVGFVNSTGRVVDFRVEPNIQGLLIAFSRNVSASNYTLNRSVYGLFVHSSTLIEGREISIQNATYAIKMINSTELHIDTVSIGGADYGIYAIDSNRSVLIANTTIPEADKDVHLENSIIYVLNITFNASNIDLDDRSELYVQNYLHVHLNDSQGNDRKGGDVRVRDNNTTVYASSGYGGQDPQTDERGYVKWIPVTDRWYNSTGEHENQTIVEVKTESWSDARNVNMSRSHTEWFQEGQTGDQKPTVNIIYPENGMRVSGVVRILGNASDDHEVVYVQVRFDNETIWHYCEGTEDWYYDWDTTAYEDGNHTIFARSYDGIQYSDVDHVVVNVDNTNEKPTVTIDSPDEDDVVSRTVVITGTADDPDGEVTKVEVAITTYGASPHDDDWDMATDTSGSGDWSSWEYDWDTLEPNRTEDGRYTIWARAYDGASYSDYARVNVSVDNNDPPMVEVRRPTNGQEVAGQYVINGSAADNDTNDQVVKVQVKIDDGPWQDADDTSSEDQAAYSYWELQWDTTKEDEGKHSIYARSYDGEVWSENFTLTVTVDNINDQPYIRIESPREAENVSGVVNITGYVRDTDDDIQRIEVSIDDPEFNGDVMKATIQEGPGPRWDWYVEWDTEGYLGNRTLYARAYDGRDWSNHWTVNVTVWENVPPQITIIAPGEDGAWVYKGETTKYTIQWDDYDPDDNATIDIYYSSQRKSSDLHHIVTWYEDWTDGAGREWDDYVWDVSDVPEGNYWIYAVISDGENIDGSDWSDGPVRIREGVYNELPSLVIYEPNGVDDEIEENETYVITFVASDPENDDCIIYFRLDSDRDFDGDEKRINNDRPLGLNDTYYEWDTTNVTRGVYYIMGEIWDGIADHDYVRVWSDGPVTIGDVTPPAEVGNLTAENTGFGGSVMLIWTSPGDDVNRGQVSRYAVRYHTSKITKATWDDAIPYDTGITLTNPGDTVEAEIKGLRNGRTYYFAVRAIDDAGNMGDIVTAQAVPTRRLTSVSATALPPDFSSAILWYLGTGDVMIHQTTESPPGGQKDLGLYIEATPSGYVKPIFLNITHKSTSYEKLMSGLDVDNLKMWRKSGAMWKVIDESGYKPSESLIWAHIDHLSVFAPLAPALGKPEIGVLEISPSSGDEDTEFSFSVTYRDDRRRVPDNVYLYVDGRRYEMEVKSGDPADPENGAVYSISGLKFDADDYVLYVKFIMGNQEYRSSQRTLTVEKKEVRTGIGMYLAIAVAALLLIVLLVVYARVRAVRRKMAPKEEAVAKEPAKKEEAVEAEVIEAEVIEAPFVEMPEAEIEADVEVTETPRVRLPEMPGPPSPPAHVDAGARVPQPSAEAMPKAREVQVAPPRPEVEKVAEGLDVGRLLIVPCPSCGHRLIIPKERPAEVHCENCDIDFVVR